MSKYTVAITGLNAADVPCPGIGVIRSIREGLGQDIKIIGLAYELLCSASYAYDLIDAVYSVSFPQEDEEKYLSRINEITKETRIDVLVPNLDFEIPVMSRLEPELRDMGIKMLLPPESALSLCQKENLKDLANLTNVNSPRSLAFSDRRQITNAASYFTYPLLVKASHGEAITVYSLEEAIVFSNRLVSAWGWPLVMQEFIKGDEYCVASLTDRRRRVVGSVCMKKILKSKNGSAWMGVTAKDDNLIKLTEMIMERLRWTGPIEIEFIKEQNTGRYFLIEINPRFPGWIQLAAKAGINLPLAEIKLALRQEIAPFKEYKTGIVFARSAKDITCNIDNLAQLATKKELIYHADNKEKER